MASLLDTLLKERPPVHQARGVQAGWYAVGVVSIGAFMGQLDASIVSLTFPTLEVAFHQSVAAVSWVAIAYLLSVAVFIPVFGRLADMYGRKSLYTFGFLVFVAGSALCGASPSLGFLVGARVFQGVGAAMLQANSVAIITGCMPRDRLGRAIGVQGAAQAIGLSVGPGLGGLIISGFGWRWVFYLSVPAGLLGAALGWFLLPTTAGALIREKFDWRGAFLFAPAITALMVLLTFGFQLGLSPITVTAAIVTGAAGYLFVRDQRREEHPLIDLSLFRNATFSAGIVAGLLSYTVLFGAFFIMPFFLERVRHHDPATTGLLLMPVPIALSFVAPLGGWLTDHVGARIPALLGMAMATAGFVALAFAHSHTTYLYIGVALAVLGLGVGLFTPSNNSSIMASAPSSRVGTAGGLLNTTRSIGTALGAALTGAVLGWQLADLAHGATGTTGVSIHLLAAAFRHTLWFLAGVSLLATIAAGMRPALAPQRRDSASPESAPAIHRR